MNIIKRGSIAAISFILMLGVAGYINYKYDPSREENLGKTIYVDSKDATQSAKVSIYSEDESSLMSEEINITSKNYDDTIAVFKYDRDNMYSELMENYNKMINNSNTSNEKIKDYQEKLSLLIEQKNLINMVENIILSYGIEDVVIIPTTNDNINVIVRNNSDVSDEILGKIKKIIVEELKVDEKKISISVKK